MHDSCTSFSLLEQFNSKTINWENEVSSVQRGEFMHEKRLETTIHRCNTWDHLISKSWRNTQEGKTWNEKREQHQCIIYCLFKSPCVLFTLHFLHIIGCSRLCEGPPARVTEAAAAGLWEGEEGERCLVRQYSRAAHPGCGSWDAGQALCQPWWSRSGGGGGWQVVDLWICSKVWEPKEEGWEVWKHFSESSTRIYWNYKNHLRCNAKVLPLLMKCTFIIDTDVLFMQLYAESNWIS